MTLDEAIEKIYDAIYNAFHWLIEKDVDKAERKEE